MTTRDYARGGFDLFPTLVPDRSTWDKVGRRLRRKSAKMLRIGKFPLGYLMHGMATRAEGGTLYRPGNPHHRRIKQLTRMMDHGLADAHPVIAKLALSERMGGQAHA